MNFKRLEADLKRVRDYVDMASLGEHGWRDPEGVLCMSLLIEHIEAARTAEHTRVSMTVALEDAKEHINNVILCLGPK